MAERRACTGTGILVARVQGDVAGLLEQPADINGLVALGSGDNGQGICFSLDGEGGRGVIEFIDGDVTNFNPNNLRLATQSWINRKKESDE